MLTEEYLDWGYECINHLTNNVGELRNVKNMLSDCSHPPTPSYCNFSYLLLPVYLFAAFILPLLTLFLTPLASLFPFLKNRRHITQMKTSSLGCSSSLSFPVKPEADLGVFGAGGWGWGGGVRPQTWDNRGALAPQHWDNRGGASRPVRSPPPPSWIRQR